MKISGLKCKILLIFITIFFLVVDIFLIYFYGFDGQLLIFIYVMIGIVPVWGIVALYYNMFIPTITINNDTQTIISGWVANELYKKDRRLENQFGIFYFDEITNCEIDNNKLNIKLRYGRVKTLYLNFFTKSQILKIKKEIDKIIK